jgi:hypothetical protein
LRKSPRRNPLGFGAVLKRFFAILEETMADPIMMPISRSKKFQLDKKERKERSWEMSRAWFFHAKDQI